MTRDEINLTITRILNPVIPSYTIKENYEDDRHWNSGFYESIVTFSDGKFFHFYRRASEITKEKAEEAWLGAKVKDYCGDLNAMHEAEETLKNQFSNNEHHYWNLLQSVKPHPIYATAAQKAEAFLKALGKYKE